MTGVKLFEMKNNNLSFIWGFDYFRIRTLIPVDH